MDAARQLTESVWLIMRWRSIRLLPRNASDTIETLKWVWPPGRWPECPRADEIHPHVEALRRERGGELFGNPGLNSMKLTMRGWRFGQSGRSSTTVRKTICQDLKVSSAYSA